MRTFCYVRQTGLSKNKRKESVYKACVHPKYCCTERKASHLRGVIRTEHQGEKEGRLAQECKIGRGQYSGISAGRRERISFWLQTGGQIGKTEADGRTVTNGS